MDAAILHPAEGVHLAFVGEDLVTLDLSADVYACLPELGARLEPQCGGGFLADDPALATELIAAGLFSLTRPCRRPPSLPAPPRRSSRETRVGRGGGREAAQFLSAVLHSQRSFRGRGLRALIADCAPTRGPHRASDVLRRAVLFDRWLPWAPGQGLCLYRAYTLRRFLRAGGLEAAWVFGVRTWPFSAHCWLQAGDVVLDDDLDRVGLYVPILAG